jgi:hypothetical protein
MNEEETGVEAAAEETASSGGGDRQSTVQWGLREFWNESEMIQNVLLFICSKILEVVLN